jgi:hypothetical protein
MGTCPGQELLRAILEHHFEKDCYVGRYKKKDKSPTLSGAGTRKSAFLSGKPSYRAT